MNAPALVIPDRVRRATRSRWRVRIAVLVALVIAGLLWFWLAASRHGPSPYRTSPVERRSITRVVESTGRVDVVTRTEVPTPVAGTLVESLVHTGETVTIGQVLARLDTQSANIALQTAQASARSAKSHVSEARVAADAQRDALERTERLFARGLASDSDLDGARAAAAQSRSVFASARAERDAAEQNVSSARLQKELRTIEAPANGIVLQAPETLGGLAAPERGPLFVIGSAPTTLRIDAWVAESDIGEVRVGEAATFTVPALPNHEFSARVESIGVDARDTGPSARYLVRLSADNRDGQLLAGMTATLRIEVARAENVLAVREAALRFVPQDAATAPARSRVFRPDGDELTPVAVHSGISDGAYTQIEPTPPGALKPGDPVVIGRAVTAVPASEGGPGVSLGGR